MTVIWTPTALGQLDEIYYTIHSERDAATASKWFLKLEDAAAQLTDFPLLGPPIPENALITTFPAFTGLRQLVVDPYRIIYEATVPRATSLVACVAAISDWTSAASRKSLMFCCVRQF